MPCILFSSWGGEVVDNRGKAPQDFAAVTSIDLPEYFGDREIIKGFMGWNGIVIRSPDVDIVDLSRAYLTAVLDHSKTCGKCNYCKTGWEEMLDVIEDIAKGDATEEDLEFMQSAAEAIISNAKCSIGKIGPNPFLESLRYFADDFAKAARGERTVNRGTYRSKLTAPCMDACPLHLDVPKYIEHIKDAKFAESLEVIQERLPLPGTLGRACFRPCESRCRRAIVDEAISIKALKRFVADHAWDQRKSAPYTINPSETTGKVAIVGAGPAGLTCAFFLATRGHQVTVYEKLGHPGGMSVVGIPDYRLPRSILQQEVALLENLGVTFHFTQSVGKDVTLSQLEERFDAVFIGIGAHQSPAMGIEGEPEGYSGVFAGLDYLKAINDGQDPYPEGKTVVVIGGGNVAIDCARSSLRLNKEEVHLVYRRTRDEMPADPAEIQEAQEERVVFHFLTAPVRIRGKNGKVTGIECIRMELGPPDKSGRPRPIPIEGSGFVFECDIVVSAIGQLTDTAVLQGVEDVRTTPRKTIAVDECTKQSDRPKLFFAGDCETGPDSLVSACAGGRKAALSIDRWIHHQPLECDSEDHFDRFFRSVKVFEPNEKILKVESRSRLNPPALPLEKRVPGFDEVEQAFSAKEAVAEAERCLRCYQVATIAV
ncbi:MAG: FAD-dependent oxidoreductase [Deltaproteobacteria bacterium]|nr:FAD-dependent oxidoreductase [Deltaproteobacteria bacterium]